MRKLIVILSAAFLLISSVAMGDDTFRYRIGAIYGLGNLKTGQKPYYTFNHAWGIEAGIDGSRTSLIFSMIFQENYDDSSASGQFGFFSGESDAVLAFKSVKAGFEFNYRIMDGARFRPTAGVGLGYLIWSYDDPVGDTVVQTEGERGNTANFSATEMYISGSLGLEFSATERLLLHLKASYDYLTGLGAGFSDSVNDIRGRSLMRVGIALSYRFGRTGGRPTSEFWPSSESWIRQQETVIPHGGEGDTDGDGVPDKRDRCPGTPLGAIVDKSGCPYDSDSDGVPDGLDDCPRTPRSAAGMVDIFGCPVDADYDGIPDYIDTCLSSSPGVVVDDYGCPRDSDGDGVYDGRDDCPNTAPGIEVDQRGCIDVAFLREPMVVYIDYQSGSFEIDMRTRERLQPLVRKLKILDNVYITVMGFTDNVGPAEANQTLSQKRANRMRDWLISQGIGEGRIQAIGKGETNFIASNQTAEGRAQNRRIELVFSR